MPYGEPELQDPMVLCGVQLAGDPESLREMAWTFAEEYAQLGFAEDRILQMFQNATYLAARDAWDRLGEIEIRRIVHECAAVWGRVRFRIREAEDLVQIRLTKER